MRSSVPVGEGLNHKENPVAQDHASGGEPGGRGSGPQRLLTWLVEQLRVREEITSSRYGVSLGSRVG
jgi:hypothetical protein